MQFCVSFLSSHGNQDFKMHRFLLKLLSLLLVHILSLLAPHNLNVLNTKKYVISSSEFVTS